jgi:hypothetical protein
MRWKKKDFGFQTGDFRMIRKKEGFIISHCDTWELYHKDLLIYKWENLEASESWYKVLAGFERRVYIYFLRQKKIKI